MLVAVIARVPKSTRKKCSYTTLWFIVNHYSLMTQITAIFSHKYFTWYCGDVCKVWWVGYLMLTLLQNLLPSQPVKELWKSVSIWRSYWHKCGYPVFWTALYVHSVAFSYCFKELSGLIFTTFLLLSGKLHCMLLLLFFPGGSSSPTPAAYLPQGAHQTVVQPHCASAGLYE